MELIIHLFFSPFHIGRNPEKLKFDFLSAGISFFRIPPAEVI